MKILAVDDSKSALDMVYDVLIQEGFEVIRACDGKEGMLKLLNNYVGLIITDLHMPYIDGIELLRRVKRSHIHKLTPVIMLTTESQRHKVLEAISLGVSAWVLKPFTPDNLLDTVKKVLDDRPNENSIQGRSI